MNSYITYTLATNLEVLRLQGAANINGFGNAAPESLVGNSGANILGAGGGNDKVNGKSATTRSPAARAPDTLVARRATTPSSITPSPRAASAPGCATSSTASSTARTASTCR